MTPIPLFAVPILNRGDLLLRLVNSIDYPIQKFYIINNGNDASVLDAIEKIKVGISNNIITCEVYTPEKNLGVATSWNKIMSENSTLPYWYICANDMMLANAGELKKLHEYVMANHETKSMIYVDGYSFFCMTQRGLDVIGTFDENIYPAYMEDADHHYRAQLAKADMAHNACDVKMIHGEPPNHGSTTCFSNQRYNLANGKSHSNNVYYYYSKWGGGGGQEKFTSPFNNPSFSIKDWTLNEKFRAKQEEIWK